MARPPTRTAMLSPRSFPTAPRSRSRLSGWRPSATTQSLASLGPREVAAIRTSECDRGPALVQRSPPWRRQPRPGRGHARCRRQSSGVSVEPEDWLACGTAIQRSLTPRARDVRAARQGDDGPDGSGRWIEFDGRRFVPSTCARDGLCGRTLWPTRRWPRRRRSRNSDPRRRAPAPLISDSEAALSVQTRDRIASRGCLRRSRTSPRAPARAGAPMRPGSCAASRRSRSSEIDPNHVSACRAHPYTFGSHRHIRRQEPSVTWCNRPRQRQLDARESLPVTGS